MIRGYIIYRPIFVIRTHLLFPLRSTLRQLSITFIQSHRQGSKFLAPPALPTAFTLKILPHAALSHTSFNLEGGKLPKKAVSGSKNQRGTSKAILKRLNTSSPSRSSSPAKRSHSEMEVSSEGDGGGGIDDVPMESSVTSDSPPHEEQEQEPANKRILRSTRDMSVDMSEGDAHPKLSQQVSITPGSSSSSGPSSAANGQSTTINGGQGPAPSLDEQIAIITKAVQETLSDGMKGYIISNKWLTEAQERGTAVSKSSKQTKDERQSPVDNRPLIDTSLGRLVDAEGNEFVPLKPGLVVDKDIQILPDSAWKQIVQWYGVVADSPDIIRWCHNTSEGSLENLQYELNPPIFTLVKLAWFPDSTSKDAMAQKDLPPIRIVASRHEKFQNFLKRAKTAAHIRNSVVRLWTTAESVVTSLKNAGMPTPAQSRSASPAPGSLQAINIGDKLILDLRTFTELPDGAAQITDTKDETSNANYNGKSTLDTFGLARPGVLILEEQIGGPAGGEWISEASRATLAQHGITKNSTSSLKPSASGRSSPAPSGIMTRGRSKKNGRSRGVVGLSNLGNSCYMNAALQCVRAIKELTYYFLDGKYKDEINASNPLGYGGDIAKVYANLLKEIYTQGTTSVSPRNFKQAVGRNAAIFSGYNQQDSQEFLGWLLDALQEDLNRIQKKPYVEKPDSTDEMVNDPVKLRAFADQCWSIYKARNDSVITDLFAGMYKSTLHCPVCDKVSIIFDPWSNLTLQLPVETAYHHNVHFYPLKGRPVVMEIDVSQNTTFLGFKQYIAKIFGTDAKRLVIGEVYSSKFWKLFDEKSAIADDKPQNADYVSFYELEGVPVNYPSKAHKIRSMLDIGPQPEDEEEITTLPDDYVAIPVFHRKPKGTRSTREAAGYPFVISLKRRDLGNEDEIWRAILAKLNDLTTKDFLSDGDESPEDEDTIVVNASDADSIADAKMSSAPAQSEDEFVDIESIADKTVQASPRISYPARNPESTTKRHPKCLEKGAFIDNGLRNLFSITMFKEANESFPRGWQNLQDDGTKRVKLDDRIFSRDQDSTKTSTMTAREQLKRALANNGSPDGSEDEYTTNGITPPTSDSFDEDEDSRVKSVYSFSSRASNSTGRNKPVTYSSKGRRRSQRKALHAGSLDGANSDSEHDAPAPPKLALIHTGEGVVLEWKLEAWNHVFGDSDEFATTGNSELVHPNPEAAAKKAARDRKSKDGVTLEECLDELEKEEVLSEADAWYCPRCKEHRRATKKFELWAVPDILVIHLKRFTTNGRSKLSIQVDFPLEGLDMTKRVSVRSDDRELIYDLVGVDNHFGGLGGGHYTALAENFEDGRWYDFNGNFRPLHHKTIAN